MASIFSEHSRIPEKYKNMKTYHFFGGNTWSDPQQSCSFLAETSTLLDQAVNKVYYHLELEKFLMVPKCSLGITV